MISDYPRFDKGLQSPLIIIDGTSLPPRDIHGYHIQTGWVFEIVLEIPLTHAPQGDFSHGLVRIYEAAQDTTTGKRELDLNYEIHPDEPFSFTLRHIHQGRAEALHEQFGYTNLSKDGVADVEW